MRQPRRTPAAIRGSAVPAFALSMLLVPGPAMARQEPPVVQNGFEGSMRDAPTLVERTRVGQEGPEEALLYQPVHLLFSNDGLVYVTDAGNKAIHVFDRDGRFRFRFGGEGSGPGEMRMPRGAYFNREGMITVPDLMNRRTNFYLQDGSLVRSEPMSGMMTRMDVLVPIGEGEFLRGAGGLVMMVLRAESARPGEAELPKLVEIVDSENEVLRSFGERKPHEEAIVERTLNSVILAGGQRKIAVAFRYSDDIRVYDSESGRLERVIRRRTAFTLRAPSIGERRSSTGTTTGGGANSTTILRDQVTVHAAFDPAGRLWVLTRLFGAQEYQKKEEEGETRGLTRLEVFDQQGRLLAGIPMGEPVSRLYFDPRGDLWLLDNEFEARIRRMEVRWP